MEIEEMSKEPSLKIKISFWVLLGILSVFFAEVIAGSSIYPFFTPVGWFIVFPVYELHIIVLGSIVFRYGRANIYTLFPAGMLFGMYEAYITKVIWSPPWAYFPKIGGISLLSFPILVFFWHPFLSFIVPLFVGETLLTSSRDILLGFDSKIKELFKTRKNVVKYGVIFSILAGLFRGASLGKPLVALTSPLFSGLFVLFLIFLWRKFVGAKYTMDSLLPQKRGMVVYLILLLLLYIIFGATMRREYLPPLTEQVNIWLIYFLLILLLWVNLKNSRKDVRKEEVKTAKFTYFLSILFILIFSFFSFIISFSDIRWIFILAIWIAGVAYGIKVLIFSVGYSFKFQSPALLAHGRSRKHH